MRTLLVRMGRIVAASTLATTSAAIPLVRVGFGIVCTTMRRAPRPVGATSIMLHRRVAIASVANMARMRIERIAAVRRCAALLGVERLPHLSPALNAVGTAFALAEGSGITIVFATGSR